MQWFSGKTPEEQMNEQMNNESKLKLLQHIHTINKCCEKLQDQILNPLISLSMDNFQSDLNLQQMFRHVEAIKNQTKDQE